MNKLLLGTTALMGVAVMSAPALAAERIQLQLRGYHVGGASIMDSNCFGNFKNACNGQAGYFDTSGTNEFNFGSDSEVHFVGSTTLDNGLEVSFHAELELEDDSDVDDDADQIDEVYIQFQGGFGRLQFGQNDGAMYQMHIAAPNIFASHGVNQPDTRMDPFRPYGPGNPINTYGDISNDDIKLTYFTPNMNGLQFGASYTPNPCKNDTGYAGCVGSSFARNYWELSGAWQAQMDNIGLALSVGYGIGESGGAAESPSEWTIGGDLSFGGFTLGGSYRDTNGSGISSWEEDHWDIGGSYESGPWALNVTYGEMERNFTIFGSDRRQSAESWLAGVTYMYGPGMQIGVGVQTLDRENGRICCRGFDEFEGFDGTAIFLENAITF